MGWDPHIHSLEVWHGGVSILASISALEFHPGCKISRGPPNACIGAPGEASIHPDLFLPLSETPVDTLACCQPLMFPWVSLDLVTSAQVRLNVWPS